ncbi:expressed unknown protein [Seminavis robusta]|uniref:Uncharacterized protein n=1 Tax=Seminavis robusta TaxID=568900 RepID=A0A9N8E4I9_9STRA|nr:expressed unknown protein [Seminavis robusta]|eukprot:Sro642_g180220.1 n/a (267) ;mRNA; f:40765-41565
MKLTASIVALLAAPSLALQGGYLSQMGGGGSVKTSSLKPASAAGPAFGASYLDNMGGNAAPTTPAAPPAAPAAPASAAAISMSELVGLPPITSTSQIADSATAVAAGDYLSSLKVAAAPSGSGPVGYLDILTVSADTVMGGLGPATYLDNIAGAASVTAKVEAATEVTMVSNEPVLAAINNMKENMSKNQKATIDILKDINSDMQRILTAAQKPSNAAPVASETTELTSALEASVAPSAGNYLSSLHGASAGAPTGSGPGGYLDLL